VLPYARDWADSGASLSGAQAFAAFSQFHATRVATVEGLRRLRLRAVADLADAGVRG